ncbi:hypothetical protein AAVH_13888 [Aphelenchoides avenae]|nr:hypothetical protein AAVH_13888 [Aphelenchus avenae]
MAPRKFHEAVEPSLLRRKSVTVKPRQKPVKTRAKHDDQAMKTIKHAVLEGQSGHDSRCIRVKIDGRDIDYFDGFVARDDLVSELLPRFRHSVIESLTVANFGGRMKIDGDLMAKFSDIFETVSVSKEASFTEICFAGAYDRCGLMQLMNCFDSFKPKVKKNYRFSL